MGTQHTPDRMPESEVRGGPTAEDLAASYELVSRLYPYIPSLCLWRSWERAAFKGCSLPEPVLDLGCGDGKWFRFLWPHTREVIGLDVDAEAVKAAEASGVYREVHRARADAMPFPAGTFASVFANCSLEHMDHLAKVLADVHRVLRTGGVFLFSVVTDKFLEWATLPLLARVMGCGDRAEKIQEAHIALHHLKNPLAPETWTGVVQQAGFEIERCTPIVPEITSRLFLFIDALWHLKCDAGHIGVPLMQFLQKIPNFPAGFVGVLKSLTEMEPNPDVCSGVVFAARS